MRERVEKSSDVTEGGEAFAVPQQEREGGLKKSGYKYLLGYKY